MNGFHGRVGHAFDNLDISFESFCILWNPALSLLSFWTLRGHGMLEALFGTGWTSKETSRGSLLFVKCLWKSSDWRSIAWRFICCPLVTSVCFPCQTSCESAGTHGRAGLARGTFALSFTDCSTNMHKHPHSPTTSFRDFANRPMNLQSSKVYGQGT